MEKVLNRVSPLFEKEALLNYFYQAAIAKARHVSLQSTMRRYIVVVKML